MLQKSKNQKDKDKTVFQARWSQHNAAEPCAKATPWEQSRATAGSSDTSGSSSSNQMSGGPKVGRTQGF